MKIGAVGHIKVFRITLKSGAGKSSLARVDIDGFGAHLFVAGLRYAQMATLRRRNCVTLLKTIYINIGEAMIFPVRAMKSQIRSLNCSCVVLVIFGVCTRSVLGDEQRQPVSFEVSKSDSAKAGKMAAELTSLSPRVNREEARLLSECAYATVSKLRREYRMFGTPIFNNFLIYHGIRKRGYCYQWSEDLLIALDKLKLTSLELHWGEYDPGTWRENNCIVVTAKGQPFRSGIMLECWRHLGHLYFGPVVSDWERYVENSAYTHFVLARSAASNASGTNHRVTFQTSGVPKGKAGD